MPAADAQHGRRDRHQRSDHRQQDDNASRYNPVRHQLRELAELPPVSVFPSSTRREYASTKSAAALLPPANDFIASSWRIFMASILMWLTLSFPTRSA